MTRDIADRLKLFGANLEVKRIALNMDQVEAYNPPPNPAKLTDSRCSGYMERFGDESWELDALDPATLDALISEHVLALRDEGKWAEMLAQEDEDKHHLRICSENWGPLTAYLDDEYGAYDPESVDEDEDGDSE